MVNNVNVLQAVTLASGKGPALYNFIVSDSNPISVIYNPNGPDSYANSYAVYSGASGTGSVAYSSLPFFYNFTNPCTSITDPCFYSIKYNFNGGSRTENTLSLFVNRVAAFQNASLSSNETTKTINFNVVKGDPIQVLLYFPYSGGPLNYRYSLYTSANALGSSSYTFRIGTNGPATPAAIPNICSQNLSLTINAPSIVTSNQIPISVVPSPLSSNPIQVNVTLYCGTNSSTQTRLSSSNSSETIDFPIPNSFYGSCYLVAQSIMIWGPVYADSANFGIVVITQPQPLTFISPSNNSSITIPSAINVTLVTATAPSISADVQVQFNCTSSSTSTQTFNVTTNLPYLFPSYSSNSYGPCMLSVIYAPDYLILPSPISVNLKYSLTITAPSIIYIAQYFLVTINSSNNSVLTTVDLILYCSPVSVYTWQNVIIGSQQTLLAPSNITANPNCQLQTPSNDPYFNTGTSNVTVSNVQLQFALPLPSSTFSFLDQVQILVNSAQVSNLQQAPVTLQLSCSSSVLVTFAWNTSVQSSYQLTSTAFGSCSFSVSNAPSYMTLPSPVSFTIIQAQLTIIHPPPQVYKL